MQSARAVRAGLHLTHRSVRYVRTSRVAPDIRQVLQRTTARGTATGAIPESRLDQSRQSTQAVEMKLTSLRAIVALIAASTATVVQADPIELSTFTALQKPRACGSPKCSMLQSMMSSKSLAAAAVRRTVHCRLRSVTGHGSEQQFVVSPSPNANAALAST